MLLEYTKDLAYAAGRILRGKFHSQLVIEYKGEIDLVTDADKAAEEFLVATIKKSFPEHAILAEESGTVGSQKAEYLWIIDPLDGTTNYAHRFPYFSVSIAILKENQPFVGVVYNPVSDEMFAAQSGAGAWLNDEPIKISQVNSLKQSLLCTGFPYDLTQPVTNLGNYGALVKQTQGVLRLGSAALDLCQVACGRLDGFWEFALNPWDIAAGTLIVSEAGGRVSGISRPAFNLDHQEILATNGLIHQQILDNLTTS